jgi:uncharacterized membrane protein
VFKVEGVVNSVVVTYYTRICLVNCCYSFVLKPTSLTLLMVVISIICLLCLMLQVNQLEAQLLGGNSEEQSLKALERLRFKEARRKCVEQGAELTGFYHTSVL